jgi:hypothetical protein
MPASEKKFAGSNAAGVRLVISIVSPLEEARSAVLAAQVFAFIVILGWLFSHPHFEAKPNLYHTDRNQWFRNMVALTQYLFAPARIPTMHIR